MHIQLYQGVRLGGEARNRTAAVLTHVGAYAGVAEDVTVVVNVVVVVVVWMWWW